VFGVVFRARWGGAPGVGLLDFSLMMFTGLLLYNFFAECATRAPTLIGQRVGYVKHVRFPLALIPAVLVASALVQLLIGFGLVGLAIVLSGRTVYWAVLYLPVVVLPLVLGTLGCAWGFSALGVYVRDLQQLIVPLVQMGMFLSPVFYSPSMLPDPFRKWFAMNPLGAVMEMARGAIFFNQAPDYVHLGTLVGLGVVVCGGGFWWFVRTREGFSDVL
jgi:lipopolysaccharide transport system permease protein